MKYGAEVEKRIGKLRETIESENLNLGYPPRWVAIKLVENDREIKELVESKSKKVSRSVYACPRK